MPKFKNSTRFLLIRNALYKFAKTHNCTITIKGDEKNLLIFEVGDNESKRN